MITLRQLRNFWILGVATMVLVCFSNAVAQSRYKVQDLGVQHPDNLGMAMGLNNHGWTLNMEQLLDPFSISLSARLVQGTVRISIGELNARTRHAWRKEQFDQLERNQRPRAKPSVCPKHLLQIRMAKTSAVSARTLSVFRFFGKTASWALCQRWAGITGRPAPSITADKSQAMRKMVWWTPLARAGID